MNPTTISGHIKGSMTLINSWCVISGRNREKMICCTRQNLIIFNINSNLVTNFQGSEIQAKHEHKLLIQMG